MGWVGLPKTIHCNETKRTHSMRNLLLYAIISWPAVGGLAYWPVPAVDPKERIGLKVRTRWRETWSYCQRRIKRMARSLPAGKSQSRIYCWRWRPIIRRQACLSAHRQIPGELHNPARARYTGNLRRAWSTLPDVAGPEIGSGSMVLLARRN